MANTNATVLTSLDFDSYKAGLRTYLQSQSAFKDYNYDGATLSVILDLLAYNTYNNAFYLNMVGSEMFLDTAQQRDSVVLRAKELNYVPRSFRSAVANVNLVVSNVPNNPLLLTIPAGTSFTGKSGSNAYIFVTNSNQVINANTDGNFYVNNLQIYEGSLITDTFVIQPYSNTDYQPLTLSNPTIDTDSLVVVSVENNGANTISYLPSTSLLDLNSNSAVYFVQGGDNSQYQIIFGDNVVGRRPADQAVVVAQYRITNGQLPNGISIFSLNGTIGGSSNVAITTVSAASGGDIGEDINSIRYNAPRYYATQERAVTAADYETLLTVTFPEIEAIAAYGGEQTTPPQYGKVFISLKIYGTDFIPTDYISKYTTFLSTRSPIAIVPQFIEPEYLYASITTKIKYNVNVTTKQPADIVSLITSTIQEYSKTNLEDFNTTLLFSRFCSAIDASDPSIVSNQTEYTLMKKLIPSLTTAQNYTINFGAALDTDFIPEPLIHSSSAEHSVQSSIFTYNGLSVRLEDDGLGNMRLIQPQTDGNDHTILSTGLGSIDYTTGVISITNFLPQSYPNDSIRFYAKPYNLDNSSSLNVIFEIPNDEINVSVITVRQ